MYKSANATLYKTQVYIAGRLIFEAANKNLTLDPQLGIELERFAAHQNLFVRHQATTFEVFFSVYLFQNNQNKNVIKFHISVYLSAMWIMWTTVKQMLGLLHFSVRWTRHRNCDDFCL